MTLTLKEEVLQMVASIDDDNVLSILKSHIEELIQQSQQSQHDWADELSEDELKDLQAAMDEDDTEENCISHEEYLKLTAKWRRNRQPTV